MKTQPRYPFEDRLAQWRVQREPLRPLRRQILAAARQEPIPADACGASEACPIKPISAG